MANPEHSFHDNAPGAWYVDGECICCGLCESVIPEIFSMSRDGSHFLVGQQPTDAKQLALAEDARDRCPAEAIGKDRRMA